MRKIACFRKGLATVAAALVAYAVVTPVYAASAPETATPVKHLV
jgi:hypothetical protein